VDWLERVADRDDRTLFSLTICNTATDGAFSYHSYQNIAGEARASLGRGNLASDGSGVYLFL